MRAALFAIVLLLCSCGKEPAVSPAETGAATRVNAAVMEAARAFADAVNQGEPPSGYPGAFEKFIDAGGFEQRIFHGLKVELADGGQQIAEAYRKSSDERVQYLVHKAIEHGGFPYSGRSAAVVGISTAGRPILRWVSDHLLQYGELEVSQNEPEKGVRFVDLHHWGHHCQASFLTRVWLLNFTASFETGTWEWELSGPGNFARYSPLLLPPSFSKFSYGLPVPSSRGDIPDGFAGLEPVMLNLASRAELLAGGIHKLDYLNKVLSVWKQKFPDSPALLLRSGFITDDGEPDPSKALECRRLLKKRGVSDPLLDYRIAMLHKLSGDLKAASAFAREALQEHPASGLLRWCHFHLLVAERDFQQAAAYWPGVHEAVPWIEARDLPVISGMQSFVESTAAQALMPKENGVLEFGNHLPDSLFGPSASSKLPVAQIDARLMAISEARADELFDSEGPFRKPEAFSKYEGPMRRAVDLVLPHCRLSNTPGAVQPYHGLILVKTTLSDPARYFRATGEYPTRVTFLLAGTKPWGHVASPGVPELIRPSYSAHTLQTEHDPAGNSRCLNLYLLSLDPDAADQAYTRARDAVVAELGETFWLRGRDVVRAVTMNRHSDAVKMGTALLEENRLGAKAATAFAIAASSLNDIPLAIRSLESRREYDAAQDDDALGIDLRHYADHPGWRTFERSPSGHEWFVGYMKKSSGTDIDKAPEPPATTPAPASAPASILSPGRSLLDGDDGYSPLQFEERKSRK